MLNVVLPTGTSRQLEDHLEIRAMLERVATALGDPPEMPAEDPAGEAAVERWRTAVGKLLSTLVKMLGSHFSEEERSPMYRGNGEFTRFDAQLSRLRDQHDELMADGEALLAALHEIRPVELAARTETFLETIAGHERAENGILQEAYGSDIGVGD